jgi:hypothetical protein
MIGLVAGYSGQIKRAPYVEFTFYGWVVAALSGETVPSAHLRAGIRHLRGSVTDGGPYGGLCYMGLCQECVVQVDGVHIESFRLPVSDGLSVLSLSCPADGRFR